LRLVLTAEHAKVWKAASNLKNHLSESGVIDKMVDTIYERDDGQATVGTSIEECVDQAWLETWCSKVVDSWIDALDGVLKVKLV
jgi:hypothetical protein